MKNLEPYFDKFSETGRRILENALDETRRRNQHFISPEHILYALIKEETNLFNVAMHKLSIDPQDIRFAVEKRLENSRIHLGEGFRIAPETTEIFKYSMDYARSQNRRVIEASDILYTLTTNRRNLLEDILQNPQTSIPARQTSKIEMEVKQRYFFSGLQIKPSNFLTEFSLEKLVNKNTFSPLLRATHTGGHGGWLSGGDSEQTTHNKHESFHCWIKSEDFNKFDEQEFISSLKRDVEDAINQSGLKITETISPNSSSFRFEYEAENMKGQIHISGEMKNGYYELKAMATEKSVPKTK